MTQLTHVQMFASVCICLHKTNTEPESKGEQERLQTQTE